MLWNQVSGPELEDRVTGSGQNSNGELATLISFYRRQCRGEPAGLSSFVHVLINQLQGLQLGR